ncbi:MAG: hypothetical protein JSS02_02480 [Planctomycetes bacterium]|nr:hypothetical protein [Planctomycetota bacterium]
MTSSFAKVISAESITSLEELQDALKRDKLIMHFDVDWAIQAFQSRPVIVAFKEVIERDERHHDVLFRRLDCTAQEGPLWDAVKNWLHEQDADVSLMFSGYGAVAWIRSGEVVSAVHWAAQVGADQLVEKTHIAMTLKP